MTVLMPAGQASRAQLLADIPRAAPGCRAFDVHLASKGVQVRVEHESAQ